MRKGCRNITPLLRIDGEKLSLHVQNLYLLKVQIPLLFIFWSLDYPFLKVMFIRVMYSIEK